MKWYHNDYSEEALAEMQKEAERRVEEGRERARLLAGAAFPQAAAPPNAPQNCQNLPGRFAQDYPPQQSCPQPCSNSYPSQQCCPPPCSNSYPSQQCCPPPCSNPCLPPNGRAVSCSSSMQSPFSALSEMLGGLGSDKLIILGVLWLLRNEHADVKLLLALIYIML